MKMMEVTEKVIGDHTFYIRPFPAFVSANLSGELATLLTPMIGALAPVAGNVDLNGENGKDFSVEDIELEKLGPALSEAMSGLSGDKIEALMRKLMLQYNTISVSGPATDGEVKALDMDLVNEVFCGELQDMYVLCFEVVRINFKGFFKKLGARFGNLQAVMKRMAPNMNASATSTQISSQTLS